jgi:hypothetical protein
MNDKELLIHFIKWKLRNEQSYLNSILPELLKKSYSDLKIWAIENDIIDL